MRLVLDTNVVFSALLWQGLPFQLLTALRNRADAKLFCSEALLAELADVLSRPHSVKRLAVIGKTARDVLDDYAAIVEFVQPAAISPTSTDPDDDAVLACALAASADLVVSGDPDLLNLKHFHGVPIVPPREAIARISA
jgi:putative PIN family toxin of toxin-antitoxin system